MLDFFSLRYNAWLAVQSCRFCAGRDKSSCSQRFDVSALLDACTDP